MDWTGLSTSDFGAFDLQGLGPRPRVHRSRGAEKRVDDRLAARGSLVAEMILPDGRRPRTLLQLHRTGDWPLHIALRSVPNGGLSLVLQQGEQVAHASIALPDSDRRPEYLRLVFSWDAPRRWARLALEDPQSGAFAVQTLPAASPLRHDDLDLLMDPAGGRYMAQEVRFVAISRRIEPIGPCPGLCGNLPVATPRGYVPVSSLKRGDTVLDQDGTITPVLHAVSRTVPAQGSFAPIRLRAPFFGLQCDVALAPTQRVVLTGSEVEYMFSTEAVLAQAGKLSHATAPIAGGDRFVTYHQVILPRPSAILVAGAPVESLFIGRLRRKREMLAATLLADLGSARLPEHGAPAWPVLRDFDALVLAERRSA